MERKTIEKDELFLRQISEEVDLQNDNYLDWIKSIKEYCHNNAVFAIAPIQLGIPKRIIYIRNSSLDMSKNTNSNYDEGKVLINPSIITMNGHTRFLERCASCLDYVGTVDRPYSVEVSYYTLNGENVREVFEGFKATVFCHEFDHLNGILHIDLADDVREMSYEETKTYRNAHPYEIISKEGEFVRKRN